MPPNLQQCAMCASEEQTRDGHVYTDNPASIVPRGELFVRMGHLSVNLLLALRSSLLLPVSDDIGERTYAMMDKLALESV